MSVSRISSAEPRDHREMTPLHFAAKAGFEGIAGDLLDAGADASARDLNSITPLHEAAYAGHGRVVRVLLGAGAHVTAMDAGGRTPLFMARLGSEAHHVEAAEILTAAEQLRSVAFAMGHHERLGAGSLVLRLEPEVVRLILFPEVEE
ncbi:ankyrin repeat-containing domain protein [Baffinella frigidus]|nr:ankyrin repeat-containing domain protein [Cryptophyta sp. CCMP2293]